MYTVYMHTNIVNGKKYIGITCQQPWTRRFNGDGSGYKTCTYFWHAIQKYGWNNFLHEIITICETEKEAMKLERYYISKHKTNNENFGYNIKEGGEHQVLPQCTRDKISKSNKGRKSPTKGIPMPEERKRKISEAQKGRKMPKDRYEAMCKRMKEYSKTHPPEHTFTDEDYRKAKEASMKKVRVIETGELFDSMTECANHFGVLISNLSRAIRFNRKYKGYHFEKI